MWDKIVQWVLSIVVDKLFATIRGAIDDWRNARLAKEAGAAQAKAEGMKAEADAAADTQDAVNVARDNHAKDPTDAAFKHTEFRD